MSGFNTDDSGGFNQLPGKNKDPRWDEKIPWFSMPDDNNLYEYRLVGAPTNFYNHWVKIQKKDKSWGKSIPVLCSNFNSRTGQWEKNGCKLCEYTQELNKVYGDLKINYDQWPKHLSGMGARMSMAINAIVRELQRQGPPAANMGSWSYIVPMKFPKGLSEKFLDLASKMNKKPADTQDPVKYWGFNHVQHGKDLLISYNSQSKDPNSMYQVQVGQATPLTADELAQKDHLVDFAAHITFMEPQKVEDLLRRSGYYEHLETLKAQLNLQKAGVVQAPPMAPQVPKSEPVATQAPTYAQAPQAPSAPVQHVAPPVVPSAFQTTETGGFDVNEQFPDHLTGGAVQQAPVAAPPVPQAAAPAPQYVAPPVQQPVYAPPVAAAPVQAAPPAPVYAPPPVQQPQTQAAPPPPVPQFNPQAPAQMQVQTPVQQAPVQYAPAPTQVPAPQQAPVSPGVGQSGES